MESSLQLHDDGAVIGYSPNLEYIKNNNIATTVNNGSGDDISTKPIKYSQSLKGFSGNSPSISIGDLEFAIDTINKTIHSLAEEYQNDNSSELTIIGNLISAFQSNNTEFIQEFLKHNSVPNGSIIPELMNIANNEIIRLKELEKTLKKMYYGDETISLERAEEIDASYIDKMKEYEKNGESYKINYVSISNDAMLNRSVSSFAVNSTQKTCRLCNIPKNVQDIETNKEKLSLIGKLFEEVDDEIKYRQSRYDIEQTIEIMKKTLYNYYENRSDFIGLYDILGNNYSETFAFNQKTSQYRTKLENAIENVNRSFLGNEYYLTELFGLEQEKAQLMKIYSDLSYN